MYNLSVYIFVVGLENTKCQRMGLRIGVRCPLLVQPEQFFEPGLFPGLPGPAVGPKGPKIGPKNRDRIYHFILLKVWSGLKSPSPAEIVNYVQRAALDSNFTQGSGG